MPADRVVLCEDSRHRLFHQSGVRNGSFHGFVYARGKRVYGDITNPTAIAFDLLFHAYGKYARLVIGNGISA
jgi:hypothetical protein